MVYTRMRVLIRAAIFSLFLLSPLQSVSADAASLIPPFPGSIVVNQSVNKSVTTYQLITGSIERVNTLLVPESSEYVQGTKQTTTYEIPNERRSKVVGNYFKQQLLERGQILFQCVGRTCGSSNHWANSVFKKAVLYGPEQYQWYFLSKIVSDQTYYVVVYVAQRGTGRLYAHVEVISAANEEHKVDGDLIISTLNLQGKYLFELDVNEVVLAAIIEAIDSTNYQFVLVAHDGLQQDEQVSAAIERTRQLAERTRKRLVQSGVSATRIAAFGAGPISPLDKDRVRRFELVALPL